MHLNNFLVCPEASGVSTPYGSIEIDKEAIESVASLFNIAYSDDIHAKEHSTQIQYPMLQYALKQRPFKIAPFIVGSMDRTALEKATDALRTILDAETLLVVSSDFTHYGDDFDYLPFEKNVREKVEQLDLKAFDTIQKLDLDGFLSHITNHNATICGRDPIALMLELLPKNAVLDMAHYETSSDKSGDESCFVCYLCVTGHADWTPPHDQPEEPPRKLLMDNEKRALLSFARRSIQHKLETGESLPADYFKDDASEDMQLPMGCFVTLKTTPDDELRGCIGEIIAHRPLYEAVTDLAVQSAFEDPRFIPLQPDEFDSITLEISALTPSQPVASWRDIIIGKHGMTIRKHGRMAVYLPQVAPEQGWELEETLTHLALKAGLGPNDWREGSDFTVFEAIVFSESD